MRVLCRIGLHKWREYEFAIDIRHGSGRVCSRCGKREVWNCLMGGWQADTDFGSHIVDALKDAEDTKDTP